MYKAVIFDFDYTLGDSTKGIVMSANYALECLGYEKQPTEDVRKTIGLTLKETFFTLTGDINEEKAELFAAYFKKKADEIMVDSTQLYVKTEEVLAGLRKAGCKTGIVTTKFRYRITGILEKFNIPNAVDIIVGGEDVKCQKPDPEGLILAIERLGLLKENVLYVGDSYVDAKAAQAAGVDFAGVLTGTTNVLKFQEFPNVCIAEDLNDIYEYIMCNNN